MIKYPIKWRIFEKQVCKDVLIFNNIIIFKNHVDQKTIINEIYEIFFECNFVFNNFHNDDICIWYFYNKEDIEYLKNWINIILLRILFDNHIDLKKVKIKNNKIKIKNKIFKYNYSFDSFQKEILIYLKK